MSNNVFIRSGRVLDIVPENSTGTFTSSWTFKDAPKAAIQVVSSAAATIVFDVSNDGVNALSTALGTVTLTGADSDGFLTDSPWKYIRARATANAGNVSIKMSI